MKRSKTSAFGTVTRQGHDASDFYKRNIYSKSKIKNECSDLKGITENKNIKTNIIYNKDSQNMSEMPDNSIHLMITSPPSVDS